MDGAKLILEYIKTLIWPVILIAVFFSYEQEMLDLLKNREIDAFGLKIGQRIETISKTYETEINELKENIKNTDDSEALLSKIEDIDKNIKKELSRVQQQTKQPTQVEKPESSKTVAITAEREGFEAILNRDVNLAIAQFSAARSAWPDYHNVSELEKLLKRRKHLLVDDRSWRELRNIILQKYSWGMPQDIRKKFKNL